MRSFQRKAGGPQMNFGDVKRRACFNVLVGFLPVQGSKRQKQENMKPERNEKGIWDIFLDDDFHFQYCAFVAVMSEFFTKSLVIDIIALSIRLLQAENELFGKRLTKMSKFGIL